MLAWLTYLIAPAVLAGGVGLWGWSHARRPKPSLRAALREAVGRDGLEGFDLDRFAAEARVTPAAAEKAGRDLYSALCHRAARDGEITADERARLDALAAALRVPPDLRAKLERAAAGTVEAGDPLERSGPDEDRALDALRRDLGITRP